MRIAFLSLFSMILFSAFGQTLLAARPGGAQLSPEKARAARPGATVPTEIPAVAEAGNQFAVDLYARLSKEQPGKNLFFSPTSISIALGMTAAGAQGQTEAEMAQALHLAGILPQAHAEYRKELERWNSTDKDRGYTLRVANRLWGQKGFPFLAGYLTLTRQQYGAELGVVDFAGQTEAARQEINTWVEKQTADKIKDLLPVGVLDRMTRLVLTNAIYFKGDWASPFKKEQTHDEDFAVSAAQKVKAPLMHQNGSYPYAEEAGLQALELPYKGNDLSMFVLLPKDCAGPGRFGEVALGGQDCRPAVAASLAEGRGLSAQVQVGGIVLDEEHA